MTAPLTLGFLYPGHSAEDDLPRYADRLTPPVQLELAHTPVEVDAHRIDALLDLGKSDHLIPASDPLFKAGITSVIWACTSGSFVFGLDGAREQARILGDYLKVPASSTSLAFADALRALNLSRVAVAATYPDDVTQAFVAFLADCGIDTVAHLSLNIPTAADAGRLSADDIHAFAVKGDHPDAEALLIPDTAAHTADLIGPLERDLGKPVLTANQVSLWQGLRLAGALSAQTGLGHLFERDPAD